MTNTSDMTELADIELGAEPDTQSSPVSQTEEQPPPMETKELFRKQNECQTKMKKLLGSGLDKPHTRLLAQGPHRRKWTAVGDECVDLR